MSQETKFLLEVEMFLRETGLSARKFSQLAGSDGATLGDSTFLYRLRRSGGAANLKTVDRVQKFMAAYRAAHPTQIEREEVAA